MTSILRPNISFNVNRGTPVIVAPAKPTPHEVKSLSDIDDQANLRFYSPAVNFYHANPSTHGAVNPAKVIREAVAKALVYYYPIAGRLRERPDGRLVVECTGEGALFVEADADVPLAYLGDPITPPLLFIDRLQFDSELMSPGVVDQPLLYIQLANSIGRSILIGIGVRPDDSIPVKLAGQDDSMSRFCCSAVKPGVKDES